MDGSAKTLYWFSEENLTIEVPFFQRPYVWDEDNWQSLIDSIESVEERKLPFIGSFILQEKTGKAYWVIDGQQRITTLSIFIKAFLDSTKQGKPISISSQATVKLEAMIYKEEATIDAFSSSYFNRLVPSNADAEAYEIVMAQPVYEDLLLKNTSNICKCYLYFRNYIQSLAIEPCKTLANKLLTTEKYVIAITLNAHDDEQAIFDTVNSLGKRLTNSDIVKNYLYQKMKSFANGNQEKIKKVISHYEKYWAKVFIDDDKRDFWDSKISLGRITTTNLDAFLKDFATIKSIYVPSESGGIEGLSKNYKCFIDKLAEEELKDFSAEMSSYAETYYRIWNDYYRCNDFRISDKLNSTLLVLDQLDTSTFNPYILKLVSTNDPELDSKLLALQRFVLKRFLWKASKKNYNKCCLEVLKSDDPNRYFDDYNQNGEAVDWGSYPTQVQNLPNRPATLLLFLIEMIRRFVNGENNYSDTLIYNKSLEHIMPKKWKENWYSVPSYTIDKNGDYVEVGPEERETYRKLKILSLGNMTLLASSLNTSISNDEFKVKIDGKLNKKGIRAFVGSMSIASEIVALYDANKKWDETEIIIRERSLINELNSYYKFVQQIPIEDDATAEAPKNTDSSYFSEDYFSTHKVGQIAREAFTYLYTNDLLTDEEKRQLTDQAYSSQNFGVWLPLIRSAVDGRLAGKYMTRYYRRPINKEANAFLCKEWYERCREKLLCWLKPRLARTKN